MTDTTQTAWTEVRRRTRQYAIVVVLLVPAILGTLLLARLDGAPAIAAFIVPAWMVAALVTGWRAVLAPCPACGHPYFIPSFLNVWSKRCAHCGLPKWSDPAAWTRERTTAGNAR